MAARDNAFDLQIKLLMIGDSGRPNGSPRLLNPVITNARSAHTRVGVGKTCLLLRYANDSFSPTFITTIGIDFKIKNIQLDNKRIKPCRSSSSNSCYSLLARITRLCDCP